MDFSALSNAGLAELISSASSELARRLAAASPAASPFDGLLQQARPEPAQAPEPAADEKDYVLYIKEKVRAGGYATAAERDRVSEIADRFSGWVRAQGLPTNRNAGDWDRAAAFMSAPRARSRKS